MFYTILAIHVALCVVLIVLVLLQQGKGADMGAAFGGGSNSLLGAGGATSLVTKLTTGCAIAFMVTSIMLVNAYSSRQNMAAERSYDPLSGSVMAGAKERKAEPQTEKEAEPEAKGSSSAKEEAAPPIPPVVPPQDNGGKTQ